MDGVFKRYFESYRKKGLLPPEIDGKVSGKLFLDSEQLKIWGNNRKGLRAEFPEYDLTMGGAIDDLLIDSDGKFVPFDFKTRGYPIKEDTHEYYQHQLDLYSLLFEKNGHPAADYGYLLFFYPKSYSKNKATFITELVKMTVSPKRGLEILRKVNEIVSGKKPKAHIECAYCLYRKTYKKL
ncbi:PD-(D/E)XK nuclease family protein [Candidatus Peregrinibacteria bacterium]|nr:PD-(D/E)XK nuclease family protein [Candidatus Peregrinibacteria bacterium]